MHEPMNIKKRMWIVNQIKSPKINPLNTQLNPICHFLALLGAHHIPHVGRIRVKFINLIA
jgi:hypothetical protein